jgi:ribonucleoside-diphosphate reductase alpha chain
MHVVKRDGSREPVRFDPILERLASLSADLAKVDPSLVAQKTIVGLRDGVTTRELDAVAAETAAYLTTTHPEYGILAARIALSNVAKDAPGTFSESARLAGLSASAVAFVDAHADVLDAAIDHARDKYDYFAFKTLERSYLRRGPRGEIVERPQYMLMRVAVGIHYACGDLSAVLATYDMLSRGLVSHATPTLFNAATEHPQMASCFLMTVPEDSIDGIFSALKWCALISQHAGGIGVNVNDVRAKGSLIGGSGGTSNGLVPMLQVFDRTARYVDQGGGKRKGAIAVYFEPWHPDVFELLELKRPHGKEELRARDLFYGMWTPDLFMRRVDADGGWSLFCPHRCPQLGQMHGAAFDAEYERCESLGLAVRTVKARLVWAAVLDSLIESGTPYVLFKDACNAKNNQKHLGTLRCANLCTEILEYVSPDEVAVCNLASVALPRCVVDGSFDFSLLEVAARQLTVNLNRVVDHSYYPLREAERSNRRHRPIGIGIQGLADVFHMLHLPFESDEARALNRNIFETLYYAALSQSIAGARERGVPYDSYHGSPLSEGKLMPDLWGVALSDERHNWTALRVELRAHGALNSLLIAPMPTASTAQILGNTESFEPVTSNLFARRVLAGEFALVNQRLVADLERVGLWTPEVKNIILRDGGSVQQVPGLSDELKAVYRTVWEIKQRALVDMAADRAPFVCQGQSMNLFVAQPTHKKLTSALFHGWRRGVKNGVYYLRSRAAADAAKVTVDVVAPTREKKTADPDKNEGDDQGGDKEATVCRRGEGGGQADEGCLMCSA